MRSSSIRVAKPKALIQRLNTKGILRKLKAFKLWKILAIFAVFALCIQLFAPTGVLAVSGSIITTDSSCSGNLNNYSVGDHVWIKATGFSHNHLYSWDISPVPSGAAVAIGSHLTDASGNACFDAYAVQAGDSGEYKVTFDNKHDNYNVVENQDNNDNQNPPPPPVEPTTVQAYKVVCLSEADLPNWGDNSGVGKPAQISNTTASDYVAASNGRCHLDADWSFQYGFAEKDNTAGVNKLPGDFVGAADGTSTAGQCDPTYCGTNTNTGSNYNDWKTFDTSTSASGTVPAQVSISDLQGAPGIWVREELKPGYIPFTYPPDGPPGSNVSAEMYCHSDIVNFDNYDQITNPQPGNTYYCVAFNAPKPVTIQASKVVCLTEADLPDWGTTVAAGKPSQITATTASDFVAASNGKCHLESDWSFQYGFAEKNNTAGVNKLPGNFVGAADGTDTTGQCNPTNCGSHTFTGSGYSDWKNFDTSTSSSGTVPAQVDISDLQGAPGIWIREVLKDGYVPFTYPPDGPPGSDISAEMYCHTDIFNYDNYDQVKNPVMGNTYYCVAFNAPKEQTQEQGGGGTDQAKLTVTISAGEGDGSGTVASDDGKINCHLTSDSTCQFTYVPAGNTVTLSATPDSGSTFTGTWSGDCTGDNPVCTLVMSGDRTVNAHFSLLPDFGGNSGGDGGGFGASGNSSSGGGGGGGISCLDCSTFVPSTTVTSAPTPNPTPQVLGATLPRTGQSPWVVALILLSALAAVFTVLTKKSKIRTSKSR